MQDREDKEGAVRDRTYASSTLEDIRIFEEWLRSSNTTLSLSRWFHQGVFGPSSGGLHSWYRMHHSGPNVLENRG